MKKVLSIVLAIAMIATMSVAAFAAADDETLLAKGNVTIGVVGNYVENEDAKQHNYKVVVAWEDFTFTFTNGEYWDVDELKWKQTEGAGSWGTDLDRNITIKNYSSLPVAVSADYAEGQKGDFTFAGEGTVAAYDVDNSKEGEGTIVATFVYGDLTIDSTNVALGNIVVTIDDVKE